MRDLKPASVYEGTTGIQALDLLGRKVAMKGGSLFMNFIETLNEFVETNKGNEAMKDLVAKLETGKDKLSEITMHLGKLSMSGDPIYPVLSATPYLFLFGDVLMAYLLTWQAVIAQEKLDALGKKPEEDAEAAFYSGKVMSARFFVNNLLPNAYSNIEGIMSGDRSALEIAEEAF
jgi:hypothetical protein